MGWASTGDPLSNLQMEFSSAQAAINYCTKNGTLLLYVILFMGLMCIVYVVL